MSTVAEMVRQVARDRWRASCPFSDSIARTAGQLLGADASERQRLLADWLAKEQTCLFGRIAAKTDRIEYCLLDEADLLGPDSAIREKIQAARLQWTKRAFRGERSALIIAAISEGILFAEPSSLLQAIACRIASLYLLEEVRPDTIYHDRLYLRSDISDQVAWEWKVGVNVFAAAGDGRWWQDHRFPAGIAFSMNSVGHMVKCGSLAAGERAYADEIGIPMSRDPRAGVASLTTALELAMKTIDGASPAVSGPATYLLDEDVSSGAGPGCPFKRVGRLAGKRCDSYGGWYHTDVTVPSSYFDPRQARPTFVPALGLDFTYLYDEQVENLDFGLMGTGRRIASAVSSEIVADRSATRMRSALREIADCDLLALALASA